MWAVLSKPLAIQTVSRVFVYPEVQGAVLVHLILPIYAQAVTTSSVAIMLLATPLMAVAHACKPLFAPNKAEYRILAITVMVLLTYSAA